MEIVQEHAVFKNKKYYLDLNEKSVSVNKAAFHELKGRYYQKKNYWVFPGDIMDRKDTKESTKTTNAFEVLETDTVVSTNCSIASKSITSKTPSLAESKADSIASKSVMSESDSLVSNSIGTTIDSVASKSLTSKSNSVTPKSVTSKSDSLVSHDITSKNDSVASKTNSNASVEKDKTYSKKSSLKIENLSNNPITDFNHSYKINPPSIFLENVSTYLV